MTSNHKHRVKPSSWIHGATADARWGSPMREWGDGRALGERAEGQGETPIPIAA